MILAPMLWLAFGNLAHASCIISSASAQLCQSGAAAAVAFLRMHPKTQAVEIPAVTADASAATERLLARSGCIRAGLNAEDLDVREVAAGPITLAEGTVNILSIVLDGATFWYVAEGFVEGSCDRR